MKIPLLQAVPDVLDFVVYVRLLYFLWCACSDKFTNWFDHWQSLRVTTLPACYIGVFIFPSFLKRTENLSSLSRYRRHCNSYQVYY